MQRLIKLWKSGTGGKIIISAGSILSLCVLCGVFSSLLPSSPSNSQPTVDAFALQTSAVESAIAQIMLSQPTATVALPTFTAAPTFADVSLADYPNVAASRFQTLQEATIELTAIHNEFAADPSVSQNSDWQFYATSTLTRVVTGATELAAMNNYPAEYAAFHQEMQRLAEEAKLLEVNYTAVLNNQDMGAFNQATTNLGNVITYINQAYIEINVLSATATPAPTATVPPTATFVYIPQPTTANVGFDNNGDGKVTCADFRTQAAAQQAYNAGYTQLDGNDNDGLACESLP